MCAQLLTPHLELWLLQGRETLNIQPEGRISMCSHSWGWRLHKLWFSLLIWLQKNTKHGVTNISQNYMQKLSWNCHWMRDKREMRKRILFHAERKVCHFQVLHTYINIYKPIIFIMAADKLYFYMNGKFLYLYNDPYRHLLSQYSVNNLGLHFLWTNTLKFLLEFFHSKMWISLLPSEDLLLASVAQLQQL